MKSRLSEKDYRHQKMGPNLEGTYQDRKKTVLVGIFRNLCWFLSYVGLAWSLSFLVGGLVAKYVPPMETRTHVLVDGLDYGVFNPLEELENTTGSQGFVRILLERDFVTEPSFSQWALKIHGDKREGLKDVVVERRNENGQVVSRHVLVDTKPIAWTVGSSQSYGNTAPSDEHLTSDPLQRVNSGFHEKIDLAVRIVERVL